MAAPSYEWLALYKEPNVLLDHIIVGLRNLDKLGRLVEAVAKYEGSGLDKFEDAIKKTMGCVPRPPRILIRRPMAEFLASYTRAVQCKINPARHFCEMMQTLHAGGAVQDQPSEALLRDDANGKRYTRAVQCKINPARHFCEMMQTASGDIQLQIIQFLKRLSEITDRIDQVEAPLSDGLKVYHAALENFKEAVWIKDRASTAKNKNIEAVKKDEGKFSRAKQAYSDAHVQAKSEFSNFDRGYKDCLKKLQTLCEDIACYVHMVVERTAVIEAMFRLDQGQTTLESTILRDGEGNIRPYDHRAEPTYITRHGHFWRYKVDMPPDFPELQTEEDIRNENPPSTKRSRAGILQFKTNMSKENHQRMATLKKAACDYRLKGTGAKSAFRLGDLGGNTETEPGENDGGLDAFEGIMMDHCPFKPQTDITLWSRRQQRLLECYSAVYILSEEPKEEREGWTSMAGTTPRSIKTVLNTSSDSAGLLSDTCEVMTSKGVVKDVPKDLICPRPKRIENAWKAFRRLHKGGLRCPVSDEARVDMFAQKAGFPRPEPPEYLDYYEPPDPPTPEIEKLVVSLACTTTNDISGEDTESTGTSSVERGVEMTPWTSLDFWWDNSASLETREDGRIIPPDESSAWNQVDLPLELAQTHGSEGTSKKPLETSVGWEHLSIVPKTSGLTRSQGRASASYKAVSRDEMRADVAPPPRQRKLGVSSPTDVGKGFIDDTNEGFQPGMGPRGFKPGDGRGAYELKHSPARKKNGAPCTTGATSRAMRPSDASSPSAERRSAEKIREKQEKVPERGRPTGPRPSNVGPPGSNGPNRKKGHSRTPSTDGSR